MIILPKYDKTIGEPHSLESYEAQKPCWVGIVRQSNWKDVEAAIDIGETPPEPMYVPTRPILICNCGRPVGLKNHTVHEDGTVTASFYHKKGEGKHEDPEGCEWHEFVKLDGYSGKHYPRLEDISSDED